MLLAKPIIEPDLLLESKPLGQRPILEGFSEQKAPVTRADDVRDLSVSRDFFKDLLERLAQEFDLLVHDTLADRVDVRIGKRRTILAYNPSQSKSRMFPRCGLRVGRVLVQRAFVEKP